MSTKIVFRSCSWGKHRVDAEEEKKDEDKPESEETEKEPEPVKVKGEEYDFIVSGALGSGSESPEVKVWRVDNKQVKLTHSLTGHSLGIVSVDVSPNGKCKLSNRSSPLTLFSLDFRYCKQLFGLDTVFVECRGRKAPKSDLSWTCRLVDYCILAR